MRATIRIACCLLAAAPSVAAEDPADALHENYRKLEREADDSAPSRRLDALRAIAKPRTARAREILLRIARTGGTADDRIVALAALGPIADLATAQALAKCVETRPEPVFVEALGDALAASPDAGVASFVADALRAARGGALPAYVRAAGLLGLHDAEPALVAIHEGSPGSPVSIELATEALRALGCVGGPASLPVLLGAAGHADPRRRIAAAEALALRSPAVEEIVRALTGLLHDPDDVVRFVATLEAGRARIEPLLPEIVARLEDPRLRTRRVARDGLRAMSGRDYGYDAAAWRAWLRQRDLPDAQAGETFTFARYFGHPVMSDRVVFLVDLSGSMRFDGKNSPTRIEIAKREILAALAGLPKGCLFNLVVFEDRVRTWQKGEAEATPENVAKAVAFVEKTFAEPEGQTHTYEALEQVFRRNPKFDTVYLVSDGIPSHGPFISHEGILASVRIWNRHRRATIHTVALTLDRGLPHLAPKYEGEKDFMRRMAASTGGECRIVASPPAR